MIAVFDVTVILVNHNSGAHLDRCLQALAAQTVRPHQVVLVDLSLIHI